MQKPEKGLSYLIFLPDTEDQKLNCVDTKWVENLCKQFSAILFPSFNLSVDNFLK